MSLPYDWMPAVLYAIDRITEGLSETAACDKARIAPYLFRNYIKSSPELQALLQEAEIRGADAMVDALLDPDGHKEYGRTDPKMAKIMSDNIKFVVGKRQPKKYGDKIEISHNITMDRAIIDALTAGKNRVAQIEYDDEDIIDVQPIPMTEDEEIAALCS